MSNCKINFLHFMRRFFSLWRFKDYHDILQNNIQVWQYRFQNVTSKAFSIVINCIGCSVGNNCVNEQKLRYLDSFDANRWLPFAEGAYFFSAGCTRSVVYFGFYERTIFQVFSNGHRVSQVVRCHHGCGTSGVRFPDTAWKIAKISARQSSQRVLHLFHARQNYKH